MGEPFVASLNVTDVETLPDASCFSVANTSDVPAFRTANISLKQGNGNLQLVITTHQVITEPIVNLRVSTHCETSINRDFVLLLDPAPLVNIEKETNNLVGKTKLQPQVTNQKTSGHKVLDENASAPDVPTSTEAMPDRPVKKGRTKNKKITIPISAVDEKLMAAYTGKQRPAKKIVSEAATEDKALAQKIKTNFATDKPYLVISGGNTNLSDAKPSLSLRLETQIDLTRAVAVAPLTATDAMDEVTVMANRLGHLEKQILSLQSQNKQLRAEAEKAKNSGFSLSARQSIWLQNFLIALGIFAVLACTEWLRRRILRNRLDAEQADWFDTQADAVLSDEPTISSNRDVNNTEATIFDGPSYGQSYDRSQSSIFADTVTFIEDEKDDGDSILDNANVFIAYGRPALAIQLLQNHLGDFPTESPAIWLKLLNLLAKEGSEGEYAAAAIECKKFFNIKMPSFADAAIKDKSTIEDHPHIVTQLKSVWGSEFAVGFLNDLIYNQQSQPADGFERGTFDELFFLRNIAEILQPSNKSNPKPSLYQFDVIKPALEKVADNNLSFITTSDSNTPISAYAPTTPYEVDLLLDIDEAADGKEALTVAELNLPLNFPMLEIGETLQADAMDFLIPADGTEIDAVPEINLLDEAEPKIQAHKIAAANSIEWNAPNSKSR